MSRFIDTILKPNKDDKLSQYEIFIRISERSISNLMMESQNPDFIEFGFAMKFYDEHNYHKLDPKILPLYFDKVDIKRSKIPEYEKPEIYELPDELMQNYVDERLYFEHPKFELWELCTEIEEEEEGEFEIPLDFLTCCEKNYVDGLTTDYVENKKAKYDRRPLYIAALNNNYEAFVWLLENGYGFGNGTRYKNAIRKISEENECEDIMEWFEFN